MVPLCSDFVFCIEYLLPEAALIAFQSGYLFLYAVLLFHCGGLAALPLEIPYLTFYIIQLSLYSHFHVVSPFVELPAGLVEMTVVLLEVAGYGCLHVSLAVCVETFPDGVREDVHRRRPARAAEQLLAGLLIDVAAGVVNGAEEEVFLRFKCLYAEDGKGAGKEGAQGCLGREESGVPNTIPSVTN